MDSKDEIGGLGLSLNSIIFMIVLFVILKEVIN